jgi:hypothetical protein
MMNLRQQKMRWNGAISNWETAEVQQVGENNNEEWLVKCLMLLNVREDNSYEMEWSGVLESGDVCVCGTYIQWRRNGLTSDRSR